MDTQHRSGVAQERLAADGVPIAPGPGRLAKLREHLQVDGVDVLYLDDLMAIRYLTGFSGSAATCLIDLEAAAVLLCTDGRYLAQAAEEAESHGIELSLTSRDLLDPESPLVAGRRGATRIGVDLATLSLTHARSLDALGHTTIDVGPALRAARAIKDAVELAAIQLAASIADQAMDQALAHLAPGVTELEIAGQFELWLRRLGGQAAGFATIVAFGERTALPHAHPTRRRLSPGEAVIVDFGVEVDGYRSDATRSLVLGAPTEQWARTHALVAQAKAAGVAALRAGNPPSAVEEASRQVLRDAGEEDRLLHSIGHGVGLEIHEDPFTRRDEPVLAPGMCVTVEPGLYYEGSLGVRLEDLYLVTEGDPVPFTGHGQHA
jgi:Xaa-Pro aminopeptidase